MNKNKWSDFYSYLSVDEYLYNLSRHRFLLSCLLKLKPRSVLEAGTGSGSLSIFLSAQGLSVVSIDNDNEVLERAKKNCQQFKGNVNFILTDALNHLPFDDGFDVAFSQGVAEHFNDEQIRIYVDNQLKVSKTVIISVPNRSYWKSFGDERLLTVREWGAIIRGFNVKQICNYGREVPGRTYFKHKLMHFRFLDIIRPHHIYIEIER
jgi:SAM-dependent methyltransferase